jgi:hypothetical protein
MGLIVAFTVVDGDRLAESPESATLEPAGGGASVHRRS